MYGNTAGTGRVVLRLPVPDFAVKLKKFKESSVFWPYTGRRAYPKTPCPNVLLWILWLHIWLILW